MYGMYISRKAKNRASAYLLVISVVAILALIGSVFLMTSIDDRRESDARLEVAPVRAVADQVVSMIQLALVDDLCIGPNGPYTVDPDPLTSSDMGEVSWRAYIDYASGDPADPYDSFLASTERALSDSAYAKAGCWPKVTNLYGFDPFLVTNVNPAWEYIPVIETNPLSNKPMECYFGNLRMMHPAFSVSAIEDSGQVSLPSTDPLGDGDDSTPDAIPLIDTDGDEVRDALLFPTGSYSGTGSQYYAAVRIVDLSAFVNVNVAMNNSANGASDGRYINDVLGFGSKSLTVGMIDPSKLPRDWPDITQHGPAATSNDDAWAFKDTDNIANPNGKWDNGEIYAPGYAWLPRNWTMTTLALDEGLPRDSAHWPASSLPSGAPDTSGRGVDNTDTDFHYMQYYHGYIKRMGDPEVDPDGNGGTDSIFRPFDISDEFACRWLDSARWLNQDTFDENSTPLDNTNNANEATVHKLKSSRIARLLEDYVIHEGNPGSVGFPTFDGNYERWLDWAYYSRYLTTMSSSRELARYRPMKVDDPGTPWTVEGIADSVFDGGVAAEVAQWPVPSRKVAINRPLTNVTEKLAAFHAYRVAFAWSLGLDISMSPGDREDIYRRACGLALMLIDYLDADNDISCVDLNEAGGVAAISNDGCIGTGTANDYIYGHERTPVISHYWSKTVPVESTTTPGKVDRTEDTVIIAIHNPYDQDIDLQDWQLGPNIIFDFPNTSTPIAPGEYLYITEDHNAVNLNPSYTYIEFSPLYANAEWSLIAPATDISLPAGPPTEMVEVSYLNAADAVPSIVGTFLDPSNWYTTGDSMPAIPETLFTLLARDLDSVTGIRTPLYQCYQDVDPLAPLPPVILKDYSTGSDIFLDDPGVVQIPDAEHSYFDTMPELPIFVRGYDGDKGQLLSLAELNRLFDFGEPVDKLNSIESQMVTMLKASSYDVHHGDDHEIDSYFALGATNFTDIPNQNGTMTDINEAFYVQVPDYCRLSNYFTVNDTLADGIDNDGDGETDPSPVWNAATMRELAIPGRININTAPVATLCTLPCLFPNEAGRLEVAADMVAYRDRTQRIEATGTFPNFHVNRNIISSDLRQQLGFATTGEVAALLRHYVSGGTDTYRYMENAVNDEAPAYGADPNGNDDGYPDNGTGVLTDDITKYDMRWTYLSNLLTVNSDTYCAYIWVQEGPELNADGRRYVVVLDRTNCCKPGDRPEIRGFMEIPNY